MPSSSWSSNLRDSDSEGEADSPPPSLLSVQRNLPPLPAPPRPGKMRTPPAPPQPTARVAAGSTKLTARRVAPPPSDPHDSRTQSAPRSAQGRNNLGTSGEVARSSVGSMARGGRAASGGGSGEAQRDRDTTPRARKPLPPPPLHLAPPSPSPSPSSFATSHLAPALYRSKASTHLSSKKQHPLKGHSRPSFFAPQPPSPSSSTKGAFPPATNHQDPLGPHAHTSTSRNSFLRPSTAARPTHISHQHHSSPSQPATVPRPFAPLPSQAVSFHHHTTFIPHQTHHHSDPPPTSHRPFHATSVRPQIRTPFIPVSSTSSTNTSRSSSSLSHRITPPNIYDRLTPNGRSPRWLEDELYGPPYPHSRGGAAAKRRAEEEVVVVGEEGSGEEKRRKVERVAEQMRGVLRGRMDE